MVSLILRKIHAPLQLMVVGVRGQAGVNVLLDLIQQAGVRGQAGVHVVQSEEAGIATILHHLMEESTALETKIKLFLTVLLKIVVLLMVVGVPGQAGVNVSLDPMDIR